MAARRSKPTQPTDTGDLTALVRDVAMRIMAVTAQLEAIEARLAHQEELAELRIQALERAQADHETRLRASTDAVVRLTTLSSMAQVAQAAFALALSTVAAWLGSR